MDRKMTGDVQSVPWLAPPGWALLVGMFCNLPDAGVNSRAILRCWLRMGRCLKWLYGSVQGSRSTLLHCSLHLALSLLRPLPHSFSPLHFLLHFLSFSYHTTFSLFPSSACSSLFLSVSPVKRWCWSTSPPSRRVAQRSPPSPSEADTPSQVLRHH